MKLQDVLCVGDRAEAVYGSEGKSTALVIRSPLDEGDALTQARALYWIELVRDGKRWHNLHFFLFEDLEDLLFEEGVFTSEKQADDQETDDIGEENTLDWQATEREVDCNNCDCPQCTSFWLDHHLVPAGYPWYQKIWLPVFWIVEDGVCLFRWKLLWWFKYRGIKNVLLEQWSRMSSRVATFLQEVTR